MSVSCKSQNNARQQRMQQHAHPLSDEASDLTDIEGVRRGRAQVALKVNLHAFEGLIRRSTCVVEVSQPSRVLCQLAIFHWHQASRQHQVNLTSSHLRSLSDAEQNALHCFSVVRSLVCFHIQEARQHSTHSAPV